MLKELIKEIKSKENKDKTEVFQIFFKTGKGEYGEGDVFIGLSVPIQRQIAKKYFKEISLQDLQNLIENKIHEFRCISLFILCYKYEKESDEKIKKQYINFYLKNTKHINNWDLVDLSCYKTLGEYLLNKDRKILYDLSKSKDLWEQRVSIISTFAFIKNKEYKDTLAISENLLNHKHDLIHKAVGWMLREVGKRVGEQYEEEFLKKHYKTMPRTMLRYAIERFSEDKKRFYMGKG